MINKDKITSIDIYDKNDVRILHTKEFSFPRDFFKVKGLELVVIKSSGLPVFQRTDELTAIFQYLNGTRIKCRTRVDISTPEQLNFHVDEGIVLEERRNSFKISVNLSASVRDAVRGEEEPVIFDPELSVTILNLNIGGVLMQCDEWDFEIGDKITLCLLPDAALSTEILRVQRNNEGDKIGYGCRFCNITPPQEEKLARFIMDYQFAEREKRLNKAMR